MIIKTLRELFAAPEQTASEAVQSRRDENDPRQPAPKSGDGQRPDRLELSAAARAASAREPKNSAAPAGSTDPAQLSPDQRMALNHLQSRDRAVRTHEAQHIAAAGGYTQGGPHYDTQTGPDGKQYAIGGHVNLDMGEVPDNPQATMAKARIIRRAALAPADPSAADRSVAAAAGQMEAKAQAELTAATREKQDAPPRNSIEAANKPNPANPEDHAGSAAMQNSAPADPPGKHLNLLV